MGPIISRRVCVDFSLPLFVNLLSLTVFVQYLYARPVPYSALLSCLSPSNQLNDIIFLTHVFAAQVVDVQTAVPTDFGSISEKCQNAAGMNVGK